MVEGFVMLAEERTPRYITARINSFLDPKVLDDFVKKDGGGGA